ncbi:MAG: hypothetical protein ACLTR5_04915 [Oscillospiraceae bacterium]
MRTRKTLGGALAAILLLILTQLIAQGAAGLLAMIKLPAGVCNIIAGILYVVLPTLRCGCCAKRCCTSIRPHSGCRSCTFSPAGQSRRCSCRWP